jgi:hypothetical protein
VDHVVLRIVWNLEYCFHGLNVRQRQVTIVEDHPSSI